MHKKTKLHIGSKIAIGLCVAAIIAITCYGFIAANYRPDYYKYYNLNYGNEPDLYSIVDNKIDIVLGDLTEEEHKNTLWAIDQFDQVLNNISINIIDEPTNDHYVKIESVKDFGKKTCVGLCQHGEPTRVSIKKSLSNLYWSGTKLSVFGKVVLHELGHVLGLKDLKAEKYKGTSIMYYTYAGAQVYTDLDIENIKRYYN